MTDEDLDKALLTFWWRCYRKVGYLSREGAQRVADTYDRTRPYRCPYGDHWHNGRSEQVGSRHKSQQPSTLRKQWRRQQVKPTVDELVQAFDEKRPRVLEG